MKECTIYIDVPEVFLKGAGIPNSQFVPSYIARDPERTVLSGHFTDTMIL